MDKKRFMTYSFSSLFFLLLVGFVSAATVTIHFPAANSIQNVDFGSVDGGNITINASLEIAGGETINITVSNFNYSYRTSSSADWIKIHYASLYGNESFNLTSNEGNATYLFPWNITGLADGTTYELNVTAFDNGTVISSVTATGIVIDTTNPTSKLDVIDTITKKSKTKFFFGDKITLRCTRKDVTAGFNETNISIQTPIDTTVEHLEKSTTTKTNTEDDYDLTFTRTKNLGDYLVFCSTTDKANNVNATANFTFEVVTKPPTGGSPYQDPNFQSPVATVIIGSGSTSTIGPLTETGTSRLIAKTATAVFTIYEKEHSFTVKEVSKESVTYTIDKSFDVVIAGKETKTVDVDADGKDDVSVEFHKIFSKKADTTFKLIGVKAGPKTEQKQKDEDKVITTPKVTGKKAPWVTIVLGIIVLALLIFAVLHFMAGRDRHGPTGKQPVSFNKKDLGAYRQHGNTSYGTHGRY